MPGALPPVIGWAAATGTISMPAIVLFGIVFLWQMPHFLAIAWLYRDDYEHAGIPLLPVLEPDGRRTGQQALLYAAALWPVSLLPAVVGIAGRTVQHRRHRARLRSDCAVGALCPRPHDENGETSLPVLDYLPAVALGRARDRSPLALSGTPLVPLPVIAISDLPALNATLNAFLPSF